MRGDRESDPARHSPRALGMGKSSSRGRDGIFPDGSMAPAASYVTGVSFVVDGGMLQMGPQAGSHLTSDEWREG